MKALKYTPGTPRINVTVKTRYCRIYEKIKACRDALF